VIDIRKPHWVAAYTKPRSEKKVHARLVEAGYEAYLPLHKVLRQWSDRKKWVEEPLLRSYIFLRIVEKEYHLAIKIEGLVRYVTFEGKAVPIPDKQIEILKLISGIDIEVESTKEEILPGQKVEILVGALKGFTGEMVKHKGKQKIVIRLMHITHSILLTIPRSQIAMVKE
jgi:transcriptional antiterminator RfaH